MKKNLGTWHVVVDCFGTLNLKFYFDLLLFHLAQDLTKPQKILKKPKKHQNQPKMLYLTFLKVLPETKFVPYFIQKLKMKRSFPNFFYILFRSKTGFAIFEKKNYKKLQILNFFFSIVL